MDVDVGFLTNAEEGRTYAFRLHYFDFAGRSMEPVQDHIDHKIVVSCSMPPSTLWITAEFVRDHTGKDYCVLSPAASASGTIPVPSPSSINGNTMINFPAQPRMPDSVTLIVSVRDLHATYELQHEETIPFVPAFFVKGSTSVCISCRFFVVIVVSVG